MNSFDLGISVSVLTVFVQGLLSFFSPCVLPLLPVYIGYLSGGAVSYDDNGAPVYSRKRITVNTIFFVLGISAAFFILGLGFSALGQFLRSHQTLFSVIGGIIVILFGLYQLGIFGESRILASERRLPFALDKVTMSPVTALILGFVFSFSWTPCVGPTLSGVLLMATTARTGGQGFLLIFVYTLGFIIPFLAAGLFTTTILSFFQKHKNVVRYTVKIGGVLLILMGVLMITGLFGSMSSYFAGLSGTDAQEVTESTATAFADANEKTRDEVPPDEQMITDEVQETGLDTTDNSVAGDVASRDEAAQDVSDMAGDASMDETAIADQPAETGSDTTDEISEDNTEPAGTAAERPLYPAPDFEMYDQYGHFHRLSDYQGKVVFLNFWATWCPPCRAEMPDIQKLYEEFQEEGREDVVFLSVAYPNRGSEQDIDGITAFLTLNGYTYPALMDSTGETLSSYYITAYPTTYMIDRKGNIYGYVTGSMTEEIMRDIIEQTLNIE